jgi:hypothetical protein
MWWIYFDTGVEVGSESISHAVEPGRRGRLAYAYLHLPIVAGIIMTAVANELLLGESGGPTRAKTVASMIGGPVAYLVGVVLFKCAVRGGYNSRISPGSRRSWRCCRGRRDSRRSLWPRRARSSWSSSPCGNHGGRSTHGRRRPRFDASAPSRRAVGR